jgi:hypothetical protein
MYYAGSMGVIECIGDLNAILHHFLQRHWAMFEPSLNRFALQTLHNQVVDAVLLTNIVHCANMRVIEFGNSARLALESLPTIVVLMVVRERTLIATVRASRVS